MTSKFFKDMYAHKILNRLANAHGALDFTLVWKDFDAVVFPSGIRGHTGRVTVSAAGFGTTTFQLVADSVDWRMYS